jgi:acyl carrier protein phosphodiesterase
MYMAMLLFCIVRNNHYVSRAEYNTILVSFTIWILFDHVVRLDWNTGFPGNTLLTFVEAEVHRSPLTYSPLPCLYPTRNTSDLDVFSFPIWKFPRDR